MKNHKAHKCFVASLMLFSFLGFSFIDRLTAKTYGQIVEKSYETLAIDPQLDKVIAVIEDKRGIDVLDARTGNIFTTVLAGLEVKALALDKQRRLLASADEHNVYLLSLDTLTTIATVPLTGEPTKIEPSRTQETTSRCWTLQLCR